MFSIIMPYYKKRDFVARSISSVLNQTIQDFELLIVDDGSKDDIDTIIAGFNDRRIKLIRQNNAGVSSARNHGIESASYDWVCFLDSDDTWNTNHLSTLSKLIHSYPNVSLFCTSHKRYGSACFSSNSLLPDAFPEAFLSNDLIGLVLRYGEIIHTNSFCVRKSLFDKYGFFEEGVTIGEDTDLWFRLGVYNSIVVSKMETSNYNRDGSDLTKYCRHNYSWPFLQRKELLFDEKIPIEIRLSILHIQTKHLLSNCKHLIADGRFDEAKKTFSAIDASEREMFKKSFGQVRFLLKMPRIISKAIAKCVYVRKAKDY